MDGWTDGRMDGHKNGRIDIRTDRPFYRDAQMHLKRNHVLQVKRVNSNFHFPYCKMGVLLALLPCFRILSFPDEKRKNMKRERELRLVEG